MRRRSVGKTSLLLAMFVAPFALSGQDLPPACEKYKRIPIPSGDEPTPAQAKALAKCTSSDLYYGIGQPADPARARLCAYVEIAGGGVPNQPVFWGPAILIMVYANGSGIARNFDLALRFECEFQGDQYRIQYLEELKAKDWKGSDFDLCGANGAPPYVYCSNLSARMGEVVSHGQLDTILSKWSSTDKLAFSKLRTAAEAFFAARAEIETDASGIGHNRFAYENYSELLDDLVSALARFEKGEMPHFTHADFIKADRELNQVYTEAMKERRDADQQAPPEAHRATADGMRKTERLWLAYLVAWLQFARQKYPAVTEDSWRTWLTQQRVEQLR
jgi:uncharacterized protein YecT (DUF1311 family)